MKKFMNFKLTLLFSSIVSSSISNVIAMEIENKSVDLKENVSHSQMLSDSKQESPSEQIDKSYLYSLLNDIKNDTTVDFSKLINLDDFKTKNTNLLRVYELIEKNRESRQRERLELVDKILEQQKQEFEQWNAEQNQIKKTQQLQEKQANWRKKNF